MAVNASQCMAAESGSAAHGQVSLIGQWKSEISKAAETIRVRWCFGDARDQGFALGPRPPARPPGAFRRP